jgi:sugar phosphate isomerase/epimerase
MNARLPPLLPNTFFADVNLTAQYEHSNCIFSNFNLLKRFAMPNRRDFLKQGSLLTAGLLINKEEWFRKERPIGVQLYTVRADIAKDPRGVLEKIAKLGYKQVETFGYDEKRKWFGLNSSELSAVLKNNGLTSPAGHTYRGSLFLKDGWEDTWKNAMEDSKAIGQEYIVIPWLEPENRNGIDNYKKIAAGVNKAGEMCKTAGLKLAYHNHDFEFEQQGGQTGFETLMKETDPKLVNFELDIYWAVKAGHDPIALFKQYPGRFAMWHIKDMDNTAEKKFTEVGNGVIDFASIFKHDKESGMKYFFVEQDVCPGPPLESIEKSITYLKKNIVK